MTLTLALRIVERQTAVRDVFKITSVVFFPRSCFNCFDSLLYEYSILMFASRVNCACCTDACTSIVLSCITYTSGLDDGWYSALLVAFLK